MTKEEVVQEIKNGIVDCMSLIDEENIDEMDRCYILTKITRDKYVACYAGQIIARGLFKSIKW